jgi:gamma-glutamyltranspeptidase / glutathione hydrolase
MFLQKWSKPLTMAALLVSSSLYAASNPAVEAKNGMVVTSQHLASQVGVDILKLGGNAIDAAVAVGYAQAVVNPCCGNIGGGGFMTVHLADGTDTFINFRETAPAAANANMYLDAEGNVKKGASLYGYLAAGVPGTVLGMETARVKIRQAEPRTGHGAGHQTGARGLYLDPCRHRYSRYDHRAL